MKSILRSSLKAFAILLATAAATLAGADVLPVHGRVELVACGEIDPYAVGDACLAHVTLDDGRSVGLVAGLELLDRYDYEALESLQGSRVAVEPRGLRAIDDPAALEALAVPGEERLYFWWDGAWTVGG